MFFSGSSGVSRLGSNCNPYSYVKHRDVDIFASITIMVKPVQKIHKNGGKITDKGMIEICTKLAKCEEKGYREGIVLGF